MRRSVIIIGFLLLACSACELASDSTGDLYKQRRTVALNDTFRINIYETVRVDSADFFLTFTDVTGDSRCPKGAVCIWPGEATAHFSIPSTDQDSTLFTFVLGGLYFDPLGIQRTALGYRFTVDYLDPYPDLLDTTRTKADYNILMKIEKE